MALNALTRWGLIAFIAVVFGCNSLKRPGEGVILIMVEALGEQNYLCANPAGMESFAHLRAECEQLSRFTRAYTPSTLSQPVIATIFSGHDIHEHGVTHNGPQGLSASYLTLAETAISHGYRTGFFSGGIPMLNKFGIQQGFEKFDEKKATDNDQGFRPVLESFKAVISWLDNEVTKEKFFAVIYLPDLLYNLRTTTMDQGDERSVIGQSQWQEINESINSFIGDLKRRHRWQRTHLLFTGITGYSKTVEVTPDNIQSPMTHTVLQFRPAQSFQSLFAKSYNHLISLKSIYPLIANLLGSQLTAESIPGLANPGENIILVRSDWGLWHNYRRLPAQGVRFRQYFLTLYPHLAMYDSFSDAAETQPLETNDMKARVAELGLFEKLRELQIEPCLIEPLAAGQAAATSCPASNVDDAEALNGFTLFLQTRQTLIDSDQQFAEYLWDLSSKQGRQANYAHGWLAYFYAKHKNWEKLASVATLAQHQGLNIVLSLIDGQEVSDVGDCWSYFANTDKSVNDFYRFCDDSLLLQVIEGLRKLKAGKEPDGAFWNVISRIKAVRAAKERNLAMFMVNDIRHALDFMPSPSELYFLLPQNQKFFSLIY